MSKINTCLVVTICPHNPNWRLVSVVTSTGTCTISYSMPASEVQKSGPVIRAISAGLPVFESDIVGWLTREQGQSFNLRIGT